MDSRLKGKRTRPPWKGRGVVEDGSILPCCTFDQRNLFPCVVIFNDYQGLLLSWDLIFLEFTLHNLDVIDGTLRYWFPSSLLQNVLRSLPLHHCFVQSLRWSIFTFHFMVRRSSTYMVLPGGKWTLHRKRISDLSQDTNFLHISIVPNHHIPLITYGMSRHPDCATYRYTNVC